MSKAFHRALVLGSAFGLIFMSAAYACSCGWGGPFLAMAKSSGLVVRAEILAYDATQTAMDVQIVAVIKGTLSQQRIRIYGDNGMLCRPNVTRFPLRSQWLFVLNGAGSKPDFNGPGAYAISICGSHWLKLERDIAVGNISGKQADAIERMPVEQVIQFIRP